MRTDFFVASMVEPDVQGERFVILRHHEISREFFFASSAEERRRALPLLTEEDFRHQLTGMGLSPDEVDHQLQRARSIRPFEFIWERTTEIGFRNLNRQAVIRKTELSGGPGYQRVYEMRCDDCGHQYGTLGCDIHNRRCPRCQDGSPGLPTTGLLE